MENMGDWEQKNLIIELTQGRELAKQLQIHLNVPSSSHETKELLVQRILASYDKALSMLKCNVGELSTIAVLAGMSDSPRSLSGSPRSEDSDRDFNQDNRDGSRKRKSVPQWTKQVQVCPGSGLEGPLDDGFSWRKYGQKDILGAIYPRGYYRCTHRNVQGCLATKQVQRSNDDPTVFEITYRGRHTCTQASQIIPPPPPTTETQDPNEIKDHHQPINPHNINLQQQQNLQQSQEILFNFRTGLKVMTESLDSSQHALIPSFSFPSTSSIKAENNVFSPSILDSNNFLMGGGFSSPSFLSPTTSESNCFTMNNFGGENQNLHGGSESELIEIISAASTSVANSPTVGLNIPLSSQAYQFDPNFTFHNPGFFS